MTYDPSAPVIVIDLLLESSAGSSSLLIPVVLDTGASFTVVATDILVQLGYDPANPLLERQRIVTGSGIEYAPRITVRSATAIGQKVTRLEILCHDIPAESGVDGLLGLNFLRHFKLTLRPHKGIIELTKER
ncbi:MAG: retroviral-like aspartic protease family protein [Gammaproteobacteria bacterium]